MALSTFTDIKFEDRGMLSVDTLIWHLRTKLGKTFDSFFGYNAWLIASCTDGTNYFVAMDSDGEELSLRELSFHS